MGDGPVVDGYGESPLTMECSDGADANAQVISLSFNQFFPTLTGAHVVISELKQSIYSPTMSYRYFELQQNSDSTTLRTVSILSGSNIAADVLIRVDHLPSLPSSPFSMLLTRTKQ